MLLLFFIKLGWELQALFRSLAGSHPFYIGPISEL